MNKTKLLKQNSKEIRVELWKFFGFFAVLSLLSFFVLFFFFKSYAVQHDNIQKDVSAYKEVLNKHQQLKSKLDTIYYQMSLLSTNRVANDAFLGNYISNNIQEVKSAIGNDSVSDFKHYSFLITRLDSMMRIKSDIITITEKEQLALRDLNECIGKMSKVKTELSKDPTRGFSDK